MKTLPTGEPAPPFDLPLGAATAPAPPCGAGSRVRNGLLAALPAEVLARLRPCLERVSLKRRQVLHERNVPLTHGYFIEHGAASLLCRSGPDGGVEVATLGRRDLVGLPLILETARSPQRCVVLVPGQAFRVRREDLARACGELPALRQVLLAYVQAAMLQGQQLAVCNTRHSLEQRLARWLLVLRDQLESTEIPLTHLTISRSLGVRRAGVTTAVGAWEERGLVRRGRGRLLILDEAGLQEAACGCHRAIAAEYGRVAGPDDRTPTGASAPAGSRPRPPLTPGRHGPSWGAEPPPTPAARLPGPCGLPVSVPG